MKKKKKDDVLTPESLLASKRRLKAMYMKRASDLLRKAIDAQEVARLIEGGDRRLIEWANSRNIGPATLRGLADGWSKEANRFFAAADAVFPRD